MGEMNYEEAIKQCERQIKGIDLDVIREDMKRREREKVMEKMEIGCGVSLMVGVVLMILLVIM